MTTRTLNGRSSSAIRRDSMFWAALVAPKVAPQVRSAASTLAAADTFTTTRLRAALSRSWWRQKSRATRTATAVGRGR